MASQMEDTPIKVEELQSIASPMQSSTTSNTPTTTTAANILRSKSVSESSSTTATAQFQRSKSIIRRTKTRKPIFLLTKKQHPTNATEDREDVKEDTNSKDCYSISRKYEPKRFSDIVGNEVTVAAISSAVEKKRIAPLYLFHGPSGTGKSSTAKIFAMAVNCKSSSAISQKPCWSCAGCKKTGKFTDSDSSFKVELIESIDKLEENEVLSMIQKGSRAKASVVFVFIVSTINEVPVSISSRCHKFGFPKLDDRAISMKLNEIVTQENMTIEREAMKLIIAKSDGSLREAEYILDQLALLGSTISTPNVQQLVGLIPRNKLIDILEAALSGETIKTIRLTKEMMMMTGGVEPRAVLTALSSIIIDILSGASAIDLRSKSSRTEDDQTGRLCCALKILVETERQMDRFLSNREDQISGLLAALIEIASQDGTVFPRSTIPLPSETSGKDLQKGEICKGKEEIENIPEWARRGDMERIWEDMLSRIQTTTNLKSFLSHQAKLVSLSVSSDNTIVHLIFKTHEDKKIAQMCEENILDMLKLAIGCSFLSVNMSLEPSAYLEDENLMISQKFGGGSQTVDNIVIPTNNEIGRSKSMRMRSDCKIKHCRGLSLTSIPQIDASVERYSQDILFENANRDGIGKKNKKPFPRPTTNEDRHFTAATAQIKDSWRCIGVIRQRKQKHES